MGTRGASLVVAVVGAALLAPGAAVAAKRPNAPSRATVLRALDATVRAVPFSAGRRQAAQARRAFARRSACRANAALARLDAQIARRQRAARRSRSTARARALRRGALRSARARALLLRSLPVGRSCRGAPSVAVDTSVRPRLDLPRLGGADRPVAALVDASGRRTEFAADELLVRGSAEEIRALARRWAGKVLATVDLGDLGSRGRMALVRIRTSRADASRLDADLARLSGSRGGVGLVSSAQGVGVLAAAAREARRGGDVGINVVARGSAIAGGSAIESPRGPGGFANTGAAYDPNPFEWSYLSDTGSQRTGTAKAWQLLRRSGRDANKVGIAVLDMGFSPRANTTDFGTPLKAASNIPFREALETPNLIGCGSSGCPWHGTNVANAAFSVVDDNRGVAGTGGPVADRIVVSTLYDMFTSISALVIARGLGARVVNMSYGAPVPFYLGWSVIPFELATAAARGPGGMVLMASAGNDNSDVDGEDCFLGACWEHTWWTPCENAGVFCVGALEDDGIRKASYSNYGAEQVDLFAPGTVLVGPDPGTPQSAPGGIRAVNGTSFASPYLAGVAALVRAAGGGGPGTVENVLKTTARSSSDTKVRRYVNTLAAVGRALPRLVAIEEPATDPVTYQKGPAFRFSAFVHDPGGASPTSVTWTTATGAVLGTGPSISTAALPYGTNRVTATARFASGAAVSDATTVVVANTPPSVRIAQPASGSAFVQNETISLVGEASDLNQNATPGLSWTLDGGATPFATGSNASLDLSGVSVGTHTITLRATDEAGASTTDSVTITVGPPAANRPPTVRIDSPANNAVKPIEGSNANGSFATFDFQATASDPEGQPLTYSWSEVVRSSGGNRPAVVRSTVEDPGPQQVSFGNACNSNGTDWTLTVSDGTSSRSATVRLFGSIVC